MAQRVVSCEHLLEVSDDGTRCRGDARARAEDLPHPALVQELVVVAWDDAAGDDDR